MYKIISQKSSFLEHSITFSVDGELKTIAAPAHVPFSELIATIEKDYGEKSEAPQNESSEKTTKTKKKSVEKAE